MNHLQRGARVLTVVTVIVLLGCAALVMYDIVVSAKDTWFVKCSECGESKCGKRCCTDCSVMDAIYFYVMRAYTLIFTVTAIVGEVQLPIFLRFFKLCKFYFPRGFFHVFIGVLTVQAGLSNPDFSLPNTLMGYITIATGVFNLVFGCLCFQEFKTTKNLVSGDDVDAAGNHNLANLGPAPRAAEGYSSASGPGAI